MPIQEVIEKFGYPTALAAILIVAIWRVMLPLLLNQIKATQQILQQQLDAANAERMKRNEEAKIERDAMFKEFSKAIERRDQQSAKIADKHATALNTMSGQTTAALNAITAEIKELHASLKK